MSDRDELRQRLERRADADFESMSDAELQSFIHDTMTALTAASRPASAYDHHNPEDRARVQLQQERFRRMIEGMKEAARRAENSTILEK